MRKGIQIVCLTLVLGLSSAASADDISVLFYGDSPREVNRLNTIAGISATYGRLADVNETNLGNYDMFFAGTCFFNDLDSKASIIQDYLVSCQF